MNNLNNFAEQSIDTTKELGESVSNTAQSLKASVKSLTNAPIGSIMNNEAEEVSRFSFLRSFGFWIILILVLAFLGFNIFTYLSKGTDIITAILSPITANKLSSDAVSPSLIPICKSVPS